MSFFVLVFNYFVLFLLFLFCGCVTFVLWLCHICFVVVSHLFCGCVTFVLWLCHICFVVVSHLFCGCVTFVLWLCHICFVMFRQFALIGGNRIINKYSSSHNTHLVQETKFTIRTRTKLKSLWRYMYESY